MTFKFSFVFMFNPLCMVSYALCSILICKLNVNYLLLSRFLCFCRFFVVDVVFSIFVILLFL